MKKISLIGGGLIASDFIKKIQASDYNLLYYYPSSKFDNFNKLCISLSEKMKIKITNDINDLNKSDLIISAGNHKLLETDFIQKNIIINFHGAPLPKYGGSVGPSFALINDEKVFGCAFQKMASSLDAGPIINQYFFKISNNMTAYDLDKKSIEQGVMNLIEIIDKIFKNNIEYSYFNKNELTINKRISLKDYQYIPLKELSNKKSLQIIKAFTWPSVLEPAYTLINNQKVNLLYTKKEI